MDEDSGVTKEKVLMFLCTNNTLTGEQEQEWIKEAIKQEVQEREDRRNSKLLSYKEKVVLTSDYIDDYGHSYKEGQTGTIGNTIKKESKNAILKLDGYEESKRRAEEMWEKDGEGPNVVEYLTEVPISILRRIH